jgi:hypothetical protein
LIQDVANGETFTGLWLSLDNPTLDYRFCEFQSSSGSYSPILEILYT